MKDVEPYFKIDSDVVMADPDHDVNGYYVSADIGHLINYELTELAQGQLSV